jgi:hypothetical protein
VFPREVTERWAAKAASVPGFGDLRLPYASLAGQVMGGQASSPLLLEAIRWVSTAFADEVPIDGGSAKCDAADGIFRENYLRVVGKRGRRVPVEGVWLGTDEALHYIAPPVRGHIRWPWEAIDVVPVEHGKRDSAMQVRDPQTTWGVRLGTGALANLLAIGTWSRRDQPPPPPPRPVGSL